MLTTNHLIQAKEKETITKSLNHYQLLILLHASDQILLVLDRPRDRTEKMATENRCSVRKGPKFTGHVRQVTA